MLVFVEENHAFREMRTQMTYLASLARRYALASHYTAISHPSLPNYLTLTGGSTFGVRDDNYPRAHPIRSRSVFDQALNAGKTAKTYVDSMPTRCAATSSNTYAVKHNPWPYFTDSRRRCRRYDVPVGRPRAGALHHDIQNASLPNVGFVIPNLCHDAHDCSLTRADSWLKTWVPKVLAGRDFRSGRLAVVVTADEDDRSANNTVLTVVMHAGMQHRRVTRPLSHYSLLGYVDHVLGAPLLGHARRGFARAFGL